jgi:hypothetical protein
MPVDTLTGRYVVFEKSKITVVCAIGKTVFRKKCLR